MKVLIVSDVNVNSLSNSFIRALQKFNYDIKTFDPYQACKSIFASASLDKNTFILAGLVGLIRKIKPTVFNIHT